MRNLVCPRVELILKTIIIFSVCSQSDNPTNVGFLKYCRISSDYEQYRSLLSDFNISDGDTTGMSYVVLIPAIFRGKFTSTEAENSGCTI